MNIFNFPSIAYKSHFRDKKMLPSLTKLHSSPTNNKKKKGLQLLQSFFSLSFSTHCIMQCIVFRYWLYPKSQSFFSLNSAYQWLVSACSSLSRHWRYPSSINSTPFMHSSIRLLYSSLVL